MAEDAPTYETRPATRLQLVVSELQAEADLINSGQPCSIEIHLYPDKLQVNIKRHKTVKLPTAA